MILVDTNILSLAFRRKRHDLNTQEKAFVFALEDLLTSGLVAIIGPIRQELLSRINTRQQFDRLRLRLSVLDDLPLTTADYCIAAEFYNQCIAAGTAPGPIDMTLCAAAHTHNTPIFTTDPDFSRYAQLLPIRLHRP